MGTTLTLPAHTGRGAKGVHPGPPHALAACFNSCIAGTLAAAWLNQGTVLVEMAATSRQANEPVNVTNCVRVA